MGTETCWSKYFCDGTVSNMAHLLVNKYVLTVEHLQYLHFTIQTSCPDDRCISYLLTFKADIPLCFRIIIIKAKTVNTTKFWVFIKATCFDPRGSSSGVQITHVSRNVSR